MADNVQTALRLVDDVWNGGREESAYEIIADDCPGMGGDGPEGTLAWHRDRRAAFPDLSYEIVELVGDGDRVALRWRATGTQRGAFGPVPPTGGRADHAGATFLTFDETGRIADVWSVNELFQVLHQRGVTVVPPVEG